MNCHDKELLKEFFIYKHSHSNGEDLQCLFISPMARRRLSNLDKTVLTTLHQCFEGKNPKVVFASKYGELQRLKEMIDQYKQDGEVSPTVFSSAVHNFIAGSFSLLNNITSPYNALSAGENTLSAGFVDAALGLNGENTLFCYADDADSDADNAKSVSCLMGKNYRQGAIRVKLENKACGKEKNEFKSFIKFLSGKKEYFSTGYCTFVRYE